MTFYLFYPDSSIDLSKLKGAAFAKQMLTKSDKKLLSIIIKTGQMFLWQKLFQIYEQSYTSQVL